MSWFRRSRKVRVKVTPTTSGKYKAVVLEGRLFDIEHWRSERTAATVEEASRLAVEAYKADQETLKRIRAEEAQLPRSTVISVPVDETPVPRKDTK